MEVPFYFTLEEFQNQFKIDFVKISSENTNITLIEYYENLKTHYENTLHNCKNAKKDLQYLKEKIVIRKKNQLSGKTFDLNSEKLSIEIQQFNDTYKLPLEINIIGINIDKLENFLKQTIQETNKIIALLIFEITKQPKQYNIKPKLSNPKKLALLQELGIFDLPIMKNLTREKQNEIIGLLLDADKTEFVYKNRLNIDSKNPSYQIDKYGAYKYLEEMQNLISNI